MLLKNKSIRNFGLFFLLFTFEAFAQSPHNMYQPTELKAPEKGSVGGDLKASMIQTAELAQGVLSLPLRIEYPEERGKLLYPFAPTYHPGGGLTEWGVGFHSSLMIRRWKEDRDIDFHTDELFSPWGALKQGGDDFWYPVGMKNRVRVRWTSERVIEAYLEDGTTLSFGGQQVVESDKGVYSWYLTQAKDLQGNQTQYIYEPNVRKNSLPVLKEILYGGKSTFPAYQIRFDYDSIARPWFEYRSGTRYLLDRRIKDLKVFSKNLQTQAFELLWTYAFSFWEDPANPRFFLTQSQRAFANGIIEPPFQFGYEHPQHSFDHLEWKVLPEYDEISKKYTSWFYTPFKGSVLDRQESGVPEIEINKDFTVLKRQGDRIVEEPTEMIKFTNPSSPCQYLTSPLTPRSFSRFFGPKDELRAFLTKRALDEYDTKVVLCNRDGTITHEQILPGPWRIGPGTQLVDLNHDGKPDLIRIISGEDGVRVTAAENISSLESGIQFVERNDFRTKSVSGKVLSTWVQDLNGDGIPDLIMLYSTGLFVFWGKGNFDFEHEPEYLGLWHEASQTYNNTIGDSGDYTFADFNQDGMVDLMISFQDSSVLFLNQVHHPDKRQRLLETKVNYLKDEYGTETYPQLLDLAGTGNPQMVIAYKRRIYSAELAQPGTGLMKSVSDGKGNEIHFSYARMKPEPGIKTRSSVLSQVEFKTVGSEPLFYEFDFKDAQIQSSNRHFLGFGSVQSMLKSKDGQPILIRDLRYLFDEFAPGLLLSSFEKDVRKNDIQKFNQTQYELKDISNIPAYVAKKNESGFQSDGSRTIGLQKEFQYDSLLCPLSSKEISVHGTSIQTHQKASLSALELFPHCLDQAISTQGLHSDSRQDLEMQLRIERNALGLPTQYASGTTTLQTIQYDSQWNVSQVYTPSEGTQIFTYENDLLKRIQSDSGRAVEASVRDPSRDWILNLTTHLNQGEFQQDFRYDSWNRLTSHWDNVSQGSSASPLHQYFYQFALSENQVLAKILKKTRIDVDDAIRHQETLEYFTAAGDLIGTAQKTRDGCNEWSFVGLQKKIPALNQNITFQPETKSLDFNWAMTFDALLLGMDPIRDETQSHLGLPIFQESTLQEEVVNQKEYTHSVHPKGILEIQKDHSGTSLSRVQSMDGKSLSFSNESGETTQYAYDVFGNLRTIELPYGERHEIHYNSLGKVSEVNRTGVGSIRYHYYPQTGLLNRKEFLGHEKSPMGEQRLEYDPSGRVTHRTDAWGGKPLEKSLKEAEYQFFYDGALPKKAGIAQATLPAQAGFLTAVVGPEFKKTFIYQKDSKPLEQIIEMGNWKTLATRFQYRSDGLLASKEWNLTSPDYPLMHTTFQYLYDTMGRLSRLEMNGAPLYELIYDRFSHIETIQLHASDKKIDLDYDYVLQTLIGYSQESASQAGHKMSFSWKLNSRGFFDQETYHFGNMPIIRNYTYTPQGYLATSVDQEKTYRYAYHLSGLLTKAEKNSQKTNINLIEKGSVLLTQVPHAPLVYEKDELGRVVKIGNKYLIYGPSGRVEAVSIDQKAQATFGYDENSKRLFKKKEGKFVEAYLDAVVLNEESLIEPISVGGVYLGAIVVKQGKASFESKLFDSRGSILTDSQGQSSLPSPYGERAEGSRTQLSPAIDYAQTGYDPDLGTYRMDHRDYDAALGQFLTADPLFLENPEKCIESPMECNLYGYSKGNPVSFVDPSGLSADPGSVLLYRADNSSVSQNVIDATKVAEFFNTGSIPSTDSIKYVHASVTVLGDRQYTADFKGGAHSLEPTALIFDKVLHSGERGGQIDVFKHFDSGSFNAVTATKHAEEFSASKSEYGVHGWCSMRAEDGLKAGGLNPGTHGISSPHGLSQSPLLEKVGTYNAESMRSELPR